MKNIITKYKLLRLPFSIIAIMALIWIWMIAYEDVNLSQETINILMSWISISFYSILYWLSSLLYKKDLRLIWRCGRILSLVGAIFVTAYIFWWSDPSQRYIFNIVTPLVIFSIWFLDICILLLISSKSKVIKYVNYITIFCTIVICSLLTMLIIMFRKSNLYDATLNVQLVEIFLILAAVWHSYIFLLWLYEKKALKA